ncbi:hypothetical protein IFM89_006180 [Coptis chinensis]|uniref:Uncharacterized protein n=1 Tax=Coptis chinensis TaxID=261450 RepID=A0A835GUR7_9MAGN|nr:hypothetical protein IFM89_006180 [Coptis chinensis]
MPILDPVISETKGRPKGGTRKEKANSNERWKPAIEIASNKKKRKCVLCKSTEHDRRRCPKNPKLQANLSMPSPTDETTENLGHDHTDILNNNEKM